MEIDQGHFAILKNESVLEENIRFRSKIEISSKSQFEPDTTITIVKLVPRIFYNAGICL